MKITGIIFSLLIIMVLSCTITAIVPNMTPEKAALTAVGVAVALFIVRVILRK